MSFERALSIWLCVAFLNAASNSSGAPVTSLQVLVFLFFKWKILLTIFVNTVHSSAQLIFQCIVLNNGLSIKLVWATGQTTVLLQILKRLGCYV